MNLDQKIEKILLDAKGEHVSYNNIRRDTGTIGFSLTHSLGRLRKRYGVRLVTWGRGCAIVAETKVKKFKSNFTLPVDLWRGWVDPETGYRPTHLGV